MNCKTVSPVITPNSNSNWNTDSWGDSEFEPIDDGK